jgi:threonylcarbamoyladenosine tRNA methylthiotransferase CDKAL1
MEIQVSVNSDDSPVRFYVLLKHVTCRCAWYLKVFVRSFGCAANMADGEVLAGCLAKAGFQLANSEDGACVSIYNTCAVKGPTENHIIDVLKRVPRSNKLVVTGCLPMINFERLLREVRFDGVVGPAVGEGIVGIVMNVTAGERVVDLTGLNAKPNLDLPRQKTNPVVSVIPVNYGCMGSCAYCCVVFARGRLRSYSISEIIQRMEKDFAVGAKEFWITSQDVACYGRDIGSNLAELLEALGNLAGDFKIRVGMMTPNMVSDIQNKLVRVFGNDKVFKFLHLPVQSGDDKILKMMHRNYTGKGFKGIVNAFKTKFPNLTLATDVIVGFPGETSEAFENTLKLLEEIKPDVVNVSKFFARPKTLSAQMQNNMVELGEIKRRTKIAAQKAKEISLAQNRCWIDWIGEILIDEKGKVEGSWVGRNFAYKPIVINTSNNLLGRIVNVKVIEASTSCLKGTMV